MSADDVLMVLTLHRDGTMSIDGHARPEKLPEILRIVAEGIESGRAELREK